MLINYKNFKDENKNKVYDIIRLINKIVDIDIINRIKKLKSSSFEIDFNNISRINWFKIITKSTRKIEKYSLLILFLFEKTYKDFEDIKKVLLRLKIDSI